LVLVLKLNNIIKVIEVTDNPKNYSVIFNS
jgi:hypothetical protein